MKNSSSSLSATLSKWAPLREIRAWRQCAGPALLKNTRFWGVIQRGQRRILRIGVQDPTWCQELQFQKNSLCQEFNNALSQLGASSDSFVNECWIQLGSFETKK